MFRLIATAIGIIATIVVISLGTWFYVESGRLLTAGEYVGNCDGPCTAEVAVHTPFLSGQVALKGTACAFAGDVKRVTGGTFTGPVKDLGLAVAPIGTTKGVTEYATLTVQKVEGKDEFTVTSNYPHCDMPNGYSLTVRIDEKGEKVPVTYVLTKPAS